MHGMAGGRGGESLPYLLFFADAFRYPPLPTLEAKVLLVLFLCVLDIYLLVYQAGTRMLVDNHCAMCMLHFAVFAICAI